MTPRDKIRLSVFCLVLLVAMVGMGAYVGYIFGRDANQMPPSDANHFPPRSNYALAPGVDPLQVPDIADIASGNSCVLEAGTLGGGRIVLTWAKRVDGMCYAADAPGVQ